MITAVYLLALAQVQPPPLASPASAVMAALADCQRLPPDRQARARYLSLYAIPAKDRLQWGQVIAFWANSLSRESELVRPVLVAPDLVRLDLADYAWSAKTWELLLEAKEPYFHVEIVKTEVDYDEYGYYEDAARTKWITTRKVARGKKEIRTAASAPWLPGKEIAGLIVLTGSQIPVVRADWWLHQTAIAADRKAGYYEWLGLGKDEKDFQTLVGADVKTSQKLRKDTRAIISRSSVTLNNRSMFRVATLTEGAYWATQDFARSTDVKNSLRLIDQDTQPDASEQYGTLPNGLFAYWLQNGKAERQDTAPDTIASDGQSRGTDRRVHVGLSCVRCHVEGIRPIQDWARRVYQPPFSLKGADYETEKRLRSQYLSDLQGRIKRDQDQFAATLKALNGLTAATNAKAMADAWDWYAERDRTLADLAIELGVSSERLKTKLQVYARHTQLDPVLAGLLQGVPARHEHVEEIYALAQEIVGGGE